VTLALADLPVGSHTVVDVEGREVGVFNIAGHFYALPSVCPHQNGPLCRGRVSGTVVARRETGWKRAWVHEGEIIVCPWHMLEFRITTGECVNAPKRRLPLYRVEVDGDNLRVYGGA
jgi:nitrite reductase (NADH) small subunit